MTLATASAKGEPSARTVLLKGADENGFVFYTNYDSAKGRDLAENPRAALLFFWAELERQVRINGSVTRTTAAESEKYFHSRPIESQIGAAISNQSRPVAHRSRARAALRGVRGEVPRLRSCRCRELGRLSRQAGHDRILAGAQEPPARSPALHAPGRRLVVAIPTRALADYRSIAPSPTLIDLPPTCTRVIAPSLLGDAHVQSARASHRHALQIDHVLHLVAMHETVLDEITAERTGGAARRRILDDAGARREHAAVDRRLWDRPVRSEEQGADVPARKRALQSAHRREIGFSGIDRRARAHRDQQERVAARHFFDRQSRRVNGGGIESDRADDVGPR